MSTPAPDLSVIDQGQASARAGLGLHHLRYVLAAAEHGGFRRAARRLGVQQSAVSRRIQELEGRLGAPIFERGPQGVRLTSAGEDFVRGAQGAVGELDLTVERATEAARADHAILRLGVLAGLGGGVLQDLLRKLVATEPRLALELVEGGAETLAAALGQGRLDLAFLLTRPAGLVSTPAWRERLVVAVPVADPLAEAASLCWTDLAGRRLLVVEPVAGLVGDLVLRRVGAMAVLGRSTAPASLARLVALGQGLGLVGEGDACRATGVVYRPLARSFLSFDAVLGRRPEKPVVRQLLALLPGAA
ncbi:DNA-binding transcriptional LysR family regulator [Caulobacter rhizosphaerae]|uniref:DNA-binding transcriptional LysR family regulator n=1 Tax=Caulobacter rhizosphaerae TaxID=2010972 RepID=A0ABU1MVX8_9CAUL|nr:LysR family transcriptional regulator [Caulobacter rhizosphaerae]MDR6530248.1 DNA-binding transcriptional LysR family regulator [Caulobacter rhizosphaerae]